MKKDYIVRQLVLRSRDYGLPQYRARVYLLMFLRGHVDERAADHIVHTIKSLASVHRRATTQDIAQFMKDVTRPHVQGKLLTVPHCREPL